MMIRHMPEFRDQVEEFTWFVQELLQHAIVINIEGPLSMVAYGWFMSPLEFTQAMFNIDDVWWDMDINIRLLHNSRLKRRFGDQSAYDVTFFEALERARGIYYLVSHYYPGATHATEETTADQGRGEHQTKTGSTYA